jgi:hypothetical protein
MDSRAATTLPIRMLEAGTARQRPLNRPEVLPALSQFTKCLNRLLQVKLGDAKSLGDVRCINPRASIICCKIHQGSQCQVRL